MTMQDILETAEKMREWLDADMTAMQTDIEWNRVEQAYRDAIRHLSNLHSCAIHRLKLLEEDGHGETEDIHH